jgi:hypothetical protein
MTWALCMALPLPLTVWAGLSARARGTARVPCVAWVADVAWMPGSGRASGGASLDRWLSGLASR